MHARRQSICVCFVDAISIRSWEKDFLSCLNCVEKEISFFIEKNFSSFHIFLARAFFLSFIWEWSIKSINIIIETVCLCVRAKYICWRKIYGVPSSLSIQLLSSHRAEVFLEPVNFFSISLQIRPFNAFVHKTHNFTRMKNAVDNERALSKRVCVIIYLIMAMLFLLFNIEPEKYMYMYILFICYAFINNQRNVIV